MALYVVAFIRFHDSVLTQEIVEANSEFEALKNKMGEMVYGDEETVEHLKQIAFDCECMVSAIKILPEGWSYSE
jgi:hypothetical protein